MSKNISDLLSVQKKFSDEFFNPSDMSEQEKIERHKTFCLALHSEVSQLADAVFYKDHRNIETKTDRQKILFETIDIVRYCLANLNLWEFTPSEVSEAFDAKDAFLWDRKKKSPNNWIGQPVAIIDIDDVIAEFRHDFFSWLNSRFNMNITVDLPEYYYNGTCGNMTGEEAFMEFIDKGKMLEISTNKNFAAFLKCLRDNGYWIQLLTARPHDNLKCVYDTYSWLRDNKIPYDNVAFSAEKYRWLTDKNFFKKGAIKFAVDDSPKHAAEYADHGIKTYVPMKSYNKAVWDKQNVVTYSQDWEDLYAKLIHTGI